MSDNAVIAIVIGILIISAFLVSRISQKLGLPIAGYDLSKKLCKR
jgi:hypothetical protein